jgi:hypothetical protein
MREYDGVPSDGNPAFSLRSDRASTPLQRGMPQRNGDSGAQPLRAGNVRIRVEPPQGDADAE